MQRPFYRKLLVSKAYFTPVLLIEMLLFGFFERPWSWNLSKWPKWLHAILKFHENQPIYPNFRKFGQNLIIAAGHRPMIDFIHACHFKLNNETLSHRPFCENCVLVNKYNEFKQLCCRYPPPTPRLYPSTRLQLRTEASLGLAADIGLTREVEGRDGGGG